MDRNHHGYVVGEWYIVLLVVDLDAVPPQTSCEADAMRHRARDAAKRHPPLGALDDGEGGTREVDRRRRGFVPPSITVVGIGIDVAQRREGGTEFSNVVADAREGGEQWRGIERYPHGGHAAESERDGIAANISPAFAQHRSRAEAGIGP